MDYLILRLLMANVAIDAHTSASDPLWVKAVPIVISTLALVVSGATLLITAYYQYFGRPKLRCLLSRNVKSFASFDRFFNFTTGVTVFNEGAKYGSIYRIKMELRHASGAHAALLQWQMFVESKNAGATGQEFQPHDEFAGWADTLIIPGRSAIYKRVQFRSVKPFELVPGKYEIYVNIFQGVDRISSCSSSASFFISAQLAEAFLNTKSDPETRISLKSVSFTLDDSI